MRIDLLSKNYAEVSLYDDKKRDLILICPGGGYEFASWREAKPVAACFGGEGYHTAVYYYRETKLVHPNVINEAETLLWKLKDISNVKRIILMGFSAGGHLAAHMLVSFHSLVKGAILAYPVITSNIRFRNPWSFLNLLGNDLSKERLEAVSLERHVPKNCGPVFLFHTVDDTAVPIENSMLFMASLRMKRIPVEAHFFPIGRHGVSIATKEVPFEDTTPEEFVKSYGGLHEWVNLAKAWLKRI